MSLSDDLELLSKLPSNSPSKMEQRRGEAAEALESAMVEHGRPDADLAKANRLHKMDLAMIKDLEDTLRALRLRFATAKLILQGKGPIPGHKKTRYELALDVLEGVGIQIVSTNPD